MSKRFYVLYSLKEFYLPRIFKTKATINKYIEENNKLEFMQFAREEEAQLFSKKIEAKMEKKFKMKMVEYLLKSHREIEEINEKSGGEKKVQESEQKKQLRKTEMEKEDQEVKKSKRREDRQQQSKIQIVETKIVQEKVEDQSEVQQRIAKKPQEIVDNNFPQKQETKITVKVENKQQQERQDVEQKKETKEQVIEVAKQQAVITKEQIKQEEKQQVVVKQQPKQEIVKQEVVQVIITKQQAQESDLIIDKQPQAHQKIITTNTIKQETPPILVANYTPQHTPNLHHLFYPLSPKYLSFLYPKVIKYYNFPSICNLLRFHHFQQANIPVLQTKGPLTINISLIFKQNPGLSLVILDIQSPTLPSDVNYLKTVVLGVKGKQQAKILALIQGLKYASTFGKSCQLTINSNFPFSNIKTQQKSLDYRVKRLVSDFLIEQQSFQRVNYV